MHASDFLKKLGAAALLVGSLSIAPGTPANSADATPVAKPGAAKSDVDPQAVDALNKMGAYLRTLKTFEIKAVTTDERVLDNDQKVQFTGTADYKVRRPNGFQITVADDRKVRQFYYDGKSLTVFSPRMGFYASVAAPGTIRETLKAAYDKFGIELPLEDIFRWGTSDDHHTDLTSGLVIGYATVNGLAADQYAFREEGVDWQIWIARGDKPMPLKAVITTTDDDAQPQFSAVLSWTTNANFGNDTFAFKAPANAKPIKIAQQ
jgi:hypothetical protein